MLWDWKAKIRWQTPTKRINHASRITIPTEVANGRPMARMPQISMTTPQTTDQPLAFLTEPRLVSEFILLVLLCVFSLTLTKRVHQYKPCRFGELPRRSPAAEKNIPGRIRRVNYWEIIADNLSKAGWCRFRLVRRSKRRRCLRGA